MMIRIAVVDDEPTAIKVITEYFEQIQNDLNVTFQISKFTSGKELIDSLHVVQYEALFLDIDMPQDSGFDVSKFLRESNNNIPIVYITNRDDLMQQAFQYKVLGFVRKNHLADELPFAVKCVIQEIRKTAKRITLIAAQKNKKTKYEVAVSDVLYVESLDHHTTVHLINNTSIITREPLSSYLSKNAFEGFIQISSSCILNHTHIFSIEKDTVILVNQEILYISRRRIKTVKEQFLQLSRRPIL